MCTWGKVAAVVQRVLITGIASALGSRLAARLAADDQVDYVGGVDLTEPTVDVGRAELIRADLRNPLVAKVVESTRVDTIVHLAVTASPRQAGGRQRMKELNVIGSMQLLGAAQKSTTVRRFVLKSTTAVYGSHYADPALRREDAHITDAGRYGYAKDAVEVERYARAFARRRPDVALTILRYAELMGAEVSSPLTAYLALPVVPTVAGYDPRLQLCHLDDAAEALHRSVVEERPGTFNVAGPGVVYLSQALRMAGRPAVSLPLPVLQASAGLVSRTSGIDLSADQLAFLRYGRVGDITRLREEFGYEPAFSTRAALEDFLASGRIPPVYGHGTLRRLERSVRDRLAGASPAPAGPTKGSAVTTDAGPRW